MKIKLEHAFNCTPEEYWEVLSDDSVDREITEAADGTYELISEGTTAGQYRKHSRIVMNRDLPAAMLKVLKTDKIGYELIITKPETSTTARWDIKPMVLADRFQGGGTTAFRATPTGCTRIIEGELNVKVPLVGKMMEERLVSDVSASYDRGAEIIRNRIKARFGK